MTKIEEILKGIDKDECEDPDGWWENSGGAEFGRKKLIEIKLEFDKIGAENAMLSERLEAWQQSSREERDYRKNQITELEAELERVKNAVYCGLLQESELKKRVEELESAVRETIEENLHLADGDDCTLIKLKQVIEWKTKERQAGE